MINRKLDRVGIFLAALAVLAAAALWRNTPHLAPGAFNWAETGNTAAALVEGRGFSDPFNGGTGATAWIPPLPVWIEAGVFLVAGVKTAASAQLLLALAVVGLAATCTLLVAALPPDQPWLRGATGGSFLALLIYLPDGPFEVMSEAWLDLLLSAALLWAALRHRPSPGRGVTAGLAAVALLAPLAHAGLALATLVVLAILIWREISEKRPRSARAAPFMAAAAATLALGGWTARNAVALHHFVPLKSNFWCELHLANVASSDGLVRAEHVWHWLPFFSPEEFSRYATLGEARYVESFRAPTLAALRAGPGHFAANIARRLANALLFCRREDGSALTHTPFAPADAQRLTAAGDLLPVGGTGIACWLRIDAPPDHTYARFAAMGLTNLSGVWRDWTEKRVAYDRARFGVGGLMVGFLTAGVPTLALLGAALAGRGRLPAPCTWAALIAGVMLLPFVLVNHGYRHQLPVLAMQTVIIGACVQGWVARSRGTSS